MLDLLKQINRRQDYLEKYLPTANQQARSSSEQAVKRRVRRYQQDPAGYARDVLKVRLTPDQEAMLHSIRDNRYTLTMASHAVGKTFIAGVAANYWFDCWDEHIVYITAPTWSQALGLSFKQVTRFRREQKLPGEILGSGLVRDADEYRAGAHFIRALNAERGEGFQGEHAAPILVIFEEGVGVPGYIWEANKGLMTHPACRHLVIGNPTDEATPFGDAAKNPNYNVIRISVLDHPNIAAEMRCEPPPFPNAVRLQWLYEMLAVECEIVETETPDTFEWWAPEVIAEALIGHPRTPTSRRVLYLPNASFQGRALGIFPTQADQQVIPRGWLEGLPRLTLDNTHVPELGVDTARFGDDRSTIIGRQGPCVLLAVEVRKFDSVALFEAVKKAAKDLCAGTRHDPKRINIKVDITGGMGTGPLDLLVNAKYTAAGVNSSSKAFNEEQYLNRRSELWFDTRDRVYENRLDLSRLPATARQQLIKELSAPKYRIKSGRKVVDEKPDIKSVLGYSPDLADACNLAFAPMPRKGTFVPSVSYRG